jgi:UDP-N-acetylmuramate dehydrogenase
MNKTVTSGTLLVNEKMAKYTSWRVGGVADYMYLPTDKQDLIAFIQHQPIEVPLFWLGLGSNLLVRDGGIRGIVINTRNRLKDMRLIEAGAVYVEAGVPCALVARFCAEQGLCGAEFLAGIPGTMGGALAMNAGAFGGETWTIVETVEVINRAGVVTKKPATDFEVSYRSVNGLDAEWFLAAHLKLVTGDVVQSQQQIKALLEKRNLTQPTNLPTCGSVFKNPPRDYAARLIELSGLKGYTIGGACVSEKHANFIVNTGQATAADIETLIDIIQTQVKLHYGICLQTEVCKVGVAC